jgi:cell division protein FtsZ
VKAIMAGMGYAVMGTSTGRGERRTLEAAQRAIASPLLEAGAIDGARGILINITGSSSLKLAEVYEASTIIQSAAHEDANIIFGAVMDEKMKDEVKITVIATGFRSEPRAQRTRSEQAPEVSSSRGTAGVEPKINHRADAEYPGARQEPKAECEASSRRAAAPADARREEHPPREAAPATQQTRVWEAVQPTRPMPSLEPLSADEEQDELDVPAFLRKKIPENS